ncbi:MAG TPA: monovalent cation/H(+) antiporter subunit G [Jatrophihabitans sp.]|nr:monovalent cation/H(+) antiporter subunit G [Jatrophihabitans sp.]
MTARHVVEIVLLAGGCAVTVLASLAMLWTTQLRQRLHLLAPVTSLGSPLIAASLAVANGWSLTTGQILLIAVLLAASGPAIGMATARAGRQREQGGEQEAPE